jgi:hypothetical protein
MADGINNGEDNEFSERYLNTIEFPADEEIERELRLKDEAKRTYPFKTPSIPHTLSIIPHVMAKAKQPLKEMQTRHQLLILQIKERMPMAQNNSDFSNLFALYGRRTIQPPI